MDHIPAGASVIAGGGMGSGKGSMHYTYLSSTEPGRYVRFTELGSHLLYVEHLDMSSGSVTFWGEARIVFGN